jgi:eukaryotic-like serine/threonine-protein kinase
MLGVVLAAGSRQTEEVPVQTIDDLSISTRDLDERQLTVSSGRYQGPQLGDVIDGTYEVCGVLGSGGMGTVYLARDAQLEREVAIKVIHADKLCDPQAVERFLAEARVMARVHHPNVVTIHAFGSCHGLPYLVMEYVPGPNLAVWRQQRGTVTPAEAVLVLEALCRGVQAIHDVGAIHRDLKPSNVLVGPRQCVAVTDFGLARSVAQCEPSARSVLAGTPAYLAPEIARSEGLVPELATRIDIYALAVMAFELLTGQPPFAGPGLPALLNQHAFDAPPRPSEACPSLPPAFDAPLLHALAKAPSERPASAEAFRRGLLDALEASTELPAGLRVLVVDDDSSTLMAVRELLHLSFPGAEVITVADPTSALAIALRERPDLVITDLHMPHGGGVGLVAALRHDTATRDVPIVVVTAYGGASDWRELKALGADRFLVKPIDIETLVSVVRSLLARRGAA